METSNPSQGNEDDLLMKVNVIHLKKIADITLPCNATLLDLKMAIASYLGHFSEYFVPTCSQLLFSFEGRYLRFDEKALKEYGIDNRNNQVSLHTGIPRKMKKHSCSCCSSGKSLDLVADSQMDSTPNAAFGVE
ncbi:uncharacterized protein MONOS_8514 [Monocercomonoides exilis]|uniref:uncharacterized protein n=1 Tax=Monocercomonoides exilis TaxID=2049356 RepID=UPI00355A0A63|nr:hypothetical protein MONOS_8514 [Monocercomonoides exilis]|eukprot:MONOS_8514.1-p1 / transcript=MONOS_8514.1 / gene=MONOS_8514 / organism=Monocercomonoides_exilis_PA203 / gene_product=unspecified product / transcript_product=unspecified product / location=Mono_scaffold00323:8435-8896(-) / protein_length=134 / sequence_SO=supercontig / SO=protein_coding / is_pseudo=false